MHKALSKNAKPLFLCAFCPELVYDDVFAVWETIWAAKYASSSHFVLFIALALVEVYRDIILENNMDFTDIIKFFNGKARHLIATVLSTCSCAVESTLLKVTEMLVKEANQKLNKFVMNLGF